MEFEEDEISEIEDNDRVLMLRLEEKYGKLPEDASTEDELSGLDKYYLFI